MPLKPVSRGTLARDVRTQLSRAIVAGDLPAGAPLSEPALAEKLGVSRAPIREALIELELRGMVEFDERGRTRVPTLTREDLREILEVRLAIDPLAARLAAERRDADCLSAIDRNIDATASSTTLVELSPRDTEFHGLIVRASGNRRLLACWNVLEHQIELWITQMQRQREAVSPDTHEKTVTSHREISEAIRSGDSPRAETLARRHLAGWAETMPFLR
jgi:DNA-binding GntR family transcriptional regulator